MGWQEVVSLSLLSYTLLTMLALAGAATARRMQRWQSQRQRRLRLRRYAPGALTYRRLTQLLRRWGQEQRARQRTQRDLLMGYTRPTRLDLALRQLRDPRWNQYLRPSPMHRRLRHLLFRPSRPTSLSATRAAEMVARDATLATSPTMATTTRAIARAVWAWESAVLRQPHFDKVMGRKRSDARGLN